MFNQKWKLNVTADYWSGYDIECLLRKYGICVYGRAVYHKVEPPFITVTVDRKKANFAEYIMCRAGIQILQRPFNPDNLKFFPANGGRGSVMPGGGGGTRKDFTTALIDFITPFMGDKVQRAHEKHNLPVVKRARKKKVVQKPVKRFSWFDKIMRVLLED